MNVPFCQPCAVTEVDARGDGGGNVEGAGVTTAEIKMARLHLWY